MKDTYILDGHTPVQEPDILKWGRWLDENNHTRVALDTIRGCRVSTVFLGLDHSYCYDEVHEPVLFETMIFGGKYDQYQDRYCTWDEAIEGHKKAVKLASKK